MGILPSCFKVSSMLHMKKLANRGPRQEPIAILSVCSYEWRLKKKSWSFVAALRSTRSSLLRLRWCVSLNQLSAKSLSTYGLLQGYIRCQSSIRGPHSRTQRCRLSYVGLGREVLLCHLAIWRGHYFKSE